MITINNSIYSLSANPLLLVVLLLFVYSFVVLAQSFPSSWIYLASDGAENGTADDRRDVVNVSYNYDADYIYLQMIQCYFG